MADKPEKQNCALRLYRFIQRMQQQPPMPLAQVLLNSFGAPEDTDQREQNAILARIMVLLFGEVESLVADLRSAGHSEESIQPIVRPFDSLSGGGLASQWARHKDAFSASLPVLLFVGETLPDDGVSVTQTELSDLRRAVEELRSEVQLSVLPSEVKRFVFAQLEIISRAIRDYPLAGVKAFKTAVREAIFNAGEDAETIAEYKDTRVMTSLRQLQERAVKYAKYAIEVSKFVGALDSLYHHLQDAPAVHQLTGLVEHVLKK